MLVAGSYPRAVMVNPVTNKVYVGNSGDNTVTILLQKIQLAALVFGISRNNPSAA
jgi:DNA-binding beta-propeller fold protein YncE